MHKAGDILNKVVRRFDRPEATLAWLSGLWPSIAGTALAAHTRPVRFDRGMLGVAADSKAWQQQVESMKRELRDRVNRAWGGNLVGDVEFVAVKPGPKSVPHEDDITHIPFVRRRRA